MYRGTTLKMKWGQSRMKKIGLVVLVIISLSLTGCIHEYQITEEASSVAAEYMAGVVLKYDRNYMEKLVEPNPIDEKGQIAEEIEETPIPISAVDDTNAQMEQQEVVNQDDYTLSDVIGISDFDIEYVRYKLSDTYPEDNENAYFSLTPREGKELLVVEFSINNKKKSDKSIDLSKTKITYQLDVNVGNIYKPLLTLLENDLQYINMSIKAGKKKTALLVFEISKDVDMKNINLIVSRDVKTEIIEIK